jgi:UPF0755 protein
MWCLLVLLIAGTEVSVRVKSGETLSQVATKLHARGVVEHPSWFRLWAKVTRNERRIKAGYYVFQKPSSIRETLRILTLGKSLELKVTIPEGATLKEIAELLSVECDINKEKFLRLVHSSEYVKGFGIRTSLLEGYLFPESYLISYGADPEQVISRMVGQFFKVYTSEIKQRTKEIGFTMEEIVILASIIEKETACEREKAVISGVYHNRLRKNILLQCDATVQYALPKRKARLTYADLKIDSPYNTYLNKGLPPAPIASPGKTSIEAALWPQNNDYLYFVARGDGTHSFSKTLRQHNREKLKIKRQRIKTKNQK